MSSIIKRVLVGLLAMACLSATSSASHFRYGHITWVRTPGGGPNQVDITVTVNLFYITSTTYDPEDEGRIPHDDPEIGYDWLQGPPIK